MFLRYSWRVFLLIFWGIPSVYFRFESSTSQILTEIDPFGVLSNESMRDSTPC